MSRFSSILEQKDVAQVFDLFETYQKNSIYVVGGSIRDALLNREITDIAVSYTHLTLPTTPYV